MTGEEFRTLRMALGLTQAQLAKVLGFGHGNYIGAMENGRRAIPPLVDRLMVAYRAGYRPEDWPS